MKECLNSYLDFEGGCYVYSGQCQPSLDVIELQQIFHAEDKGQSTDTIIESLCAGKSRTQELELLVEVVQIGSSRSDWVAQLAASAWSRIIQQDLWRATYESIKNFEDAMDFVEGIQHVIQQADRGQVLIRRYRRQVTSA
ncbi:MAG: hypothetical protein M1833_001712 [Piccolia ochrophora]|nr:MAG: hypothetical protein M1833_001712 [Piccolia ochrophora]